MTRVPKELADAMIAKAKVMSHETFTRDAFVDRPVQPAKGVMLLDDMNEEERAFARHLTSEVLAGNILRAWPKPWKFLLADKCTYTPDFVILHCDQTFEVADVKAFWKASKKALATNPKAKGKVHVEEDAAVKMKVAARMFPVFRWTYRFRKDGEWKSEEVKP